MRNRVRVRVRLFSPLRRLRCAICIAPNTESHVFEEHLRKLHAPSRCMIMISSDIKNETTAISYNGRPINQCSLINGMAAVHRQQEE